jgi:hypothetical protein
LFDSFDRASYSDFADLNLRLVEHVRQFRPDVISVFSCITRSGWRRLISFGQRLRPS